MKRDDFKKSIDSITPDAYMGSRLKAKITTASTSNKSDRRIALRITAVCFAIIIVFGVGFLAPRPTVDTVNQPSTSEDKLLQNKQISAFVMVANAAGNKNEETTTIYKVLELNNEYPYEVHLNVEDISGLSEEEKTKLKQEMSNDIFNKHCSDKNLQKGHAQICSTEKIILSQCGLNEFKLDLDNAEDIKTITVSNTSKYGQIVFSAGKPSFNTPPHGSSLTVSGEEFDSKKSSFYWDHTEEMEKIFDQNINTPFSTFNDVITFTVEYKDNSNAIGIVELAFDDYGKATALCRSYNYIP